MALTPPDTTMTASPAAASSSASATFQFTSTIAGSTFECSRDGAALAACVSPVTYTGLAQGSHTFLVRAVAPSGIVDPSPATYAWTVDTTAPAISGVVAVPSQTSATVTWTTDAVDSLVDFGTSAAALSTRVSNATTTLLHTVTLNNLTAGTTYYYRITSTNAANLSGYSPSATTAVSFATVASTPPDTSITGEPAGRDQLDVGHVPVHGDDLREHLPVFARRRRLRRVHQPDRVLRSGGGQPQLLGQGDGAVGRSRRDAGNGTPGRLTPRRR